MIKLADVYYGLRQRAESARRRNEDIVMSLEEAMALHEAIVGNDVPYQDPERFLGVRVRVLEPDRPRIVMRTDLPDPSITHLGKRR